MLNFVLGLTGREKRAIFLSLDLLLVPVAVFMSFGLQYGAKSVFGLFVEHWSLTALLMMTAAAVSLMLGLPRIRLKAFESSAIGKVAMSAILLSFASCALSTLGTLNLKDAFHVTFGLIFFLACAGARMLLLEWLLIIYRKNSNRISVLIYGAGKTGMQLASALRSDPVIAPVGFVDDNRAMSGQIVAGLPVYNGAQLDEVLETVKPHRMVIAMPSADRPTIARLEHRLSLTGIEVQVVPSFAQLVGQTSLRHDIEQTAPGTFLGRDSLHKHIDIGCRQYTGRCILITGSGGTIGSELARQVMTCAPKKIVVFDISELALYNIELELREATANTAIKIVPILGSVEDQTLVRRVLNEHAVQIVLHTAAYKHVPLVETNPIQGLSNNVFGTLTLAAQARDAGVERFVLVSSDKAVRPANIMGASKRFAELIVQDMASRAPQTVFSIVRFGNVLGSSGSVVPLFQQQVARGGPVTLTHDEVTRYFMTVEEAAQLVLTAGSLAEGGELFVLDMGEPISVRHLAEQVIDSAGYTVKDEWSPDGEIEIITVGLRPGEKLHEELLIGTGRMTTKHEKIFSVHEETLSELEIAHALKNLREVIATGDEAATREVVARWISGYSNSKRQSM